MAAVRPAARPFASPAGGGVYTGADIHEGPINTHEGNEIKVKSRRILQRCGDRKRCWERIKRRAEGLLGGIVSDSTGEEPAHVRYGLHKEGEYRQLEFWI